jgi:predicted RNase H-like HicB family nuclease
MKKVEQIYRFPVVIERDSDGYFAMCPDLQGCYSQGGTYEEALLNITSAIKLHVEDRRAENEEVNQPNAVSLSTVEVSVA